MAEPCGINIGIPEGVTIERQAPERGTEATVGAGDHQVVCGCWPRLVVDLQLQLVGEDIPHDSLALFDCRLGLESHGQRVPV